MCVYGFTSSCIRLSWHLWLSQAFLTCFRNIYKKYSYWCSGWKDNLFQCPNWDGYIGILTHRIQAIRSIQISNTFVCISDKANSPTCIYLTLVTSDPRSLSKNWRESVSQLVQAWIIPSVKHLPCWGNSF